MSAKFSSPFMAKSPLNKELHEASHAKIETEGKKGPDGENQGSTEYVNKSGNRSVEIAKNFAGDETKTVRRKKKDGSIKTTSKKISDKKAARIKKRKERRLD